MKKNYFLLGLFIPLIIAVLCAGFAVIFVNMQQNLFADNYTLFELYVNEAEQVKLTVLNSDYLIDITDTIQISEKIDMLKRYLPLSISYLFNGYENAREHIYDLLDKIIYVAE